MEEKIGYFRYNSIEIISPKEPIVKMGDTVIITKEEFERLEYNLDLLNEVKNWYWNLANLYDSSNKFEEFSVKLKKLMEEGVEIFSLKERQ